MPPNRRPKTTPWTVASKRSRKALGRKPRYKLEFPAEVVELQKWYDEIPTSPVGRKITRIKELKSFAKKALEEELQELWKKPGVDRKRISLTLSTIKSDFDYYLDETRQKKPEALDDLLARSIAGKMRTKMPTVDQAIDKKWRTYLNERKIPIKPEYVPAFNQASNKLTAHFSQGIKEGPLLMDFRGAERHYIQVAKMIRTKQVQDRTYQNQLARKLISSAFRSHIRLTTPQKEAIQKWVRKTFDSLISAKQLGEYKRLGIAHTDEHANITIDQKLVREREAEVQAALARVEEDFIEQAKRQFNFLRPSVKAPSRIGEIVVPKPPKNGKPRAERIQAYLTEPGREKPVKREVKSEKKETKKTQRGMLSLLDKWKQDPRKQSVVPVLAYGIQQRLFTLANIERINSHGEIGVRILSDLLQDQTFSTRFGGEGIKAVVQALSQFPNSRGMPIELFQQKIASTNRMSIYRYLESQGYLDPTHGGGRFVKLTTPK